MLNGHSSQDHNAHTKYLAELSDEPDLDKIWEGCPFSWSGELNETCLPCYMDNHISISLDDACVACGWIFSDCCSSLASPPALLLVARSVDTRYKEVGLVLVLQRRDDMTWERVGMGLIGDWLFRRLPLTDRSNLTLV